MYKKYGLLFFLFFPFIRSFAQCPQPSFTKPDSACAGADISFINTSSGAVRYAWDFCPGDLDTLPVGTNIGNIGGLSFPNQVTYVEDNGEYFAFVANFIGNNITRIDFGTSPDNPAPSSFVYSGFNLPIGIDVVKEGSEWIALVVNYGNFRLYRLNLGSVISANNSTNTDLGQFGFDGPRNVKIAADNGNYFAFVTNDGGSSIQKIEFGNSLNNTPTSSSLTDAAFNFTWGFDVGYNCQTGTYVGFAAVYNSGKIAVIDYGSSLSSPGTVIHQLNVPSGNPSTIFLAPDVSGYHLMVLGSASDQIQDLKLGNNLLNTSPATGFITNVASLSQPRGISMIKKNSAWYGIIANAASSSISLIKFEKSCGSSTAVSDLQNPPPVSFANEGWNSIMLSAYSSTGISNAFVDSVFIAPLPEASFSSGTACLNSPVFFTDLSTITSGSITGWQWDFGDASPLSNIQNPQHQYSSPGSFPVTLSVTSSVGCVDSITQNVVVNDLPQSDFSYANNACRGALVPFTDLSLPPPSGNITGWEWNFGDGSPVSVLQNPVHAFDTAGVYVVQLVVFSDAGCSDTNQYFITIVPGPAAAFTFSNTCSGDFTSFTNLTTIQGGGPLTFNWEFGDGSTSNATNPVYQYPLTPFTYSVKLSASSLNGCTDSMLMDLRISAKADPSFSVLPAVGCVNNDILFANTSVVFAGDSIITLTWNFGDGSPLAFGDSVVHHYSAAGTYPVTLIVKTFSDCDTSITLPLTIVDSPIAGFSFQDACLDSAVTLINNSSTPPGTTIDSLVWDFGDGISITTLNDTIQHLYATYGTYPVTLTVYNNIGCTGTLQQQVTIHPLPSASWVNSYPCAGSTINFTSTSTIVSGSITGYSWDFGDGNTSTLPNASNTYLSGGVYPVSLVVQSGFGCTDTLLQPFDVYYAPQFDFTFSQTCLGKPTQFNYLNLNAGQPDSAHFWLWNFGDNSTSILPSPSHLYSQSGSYTVTLTGTSLNACSTAVVKTVNIYPVPAAGFSSAGQVCIGTMLSFSDQSTIASGTIGQWIWNFGDNSPLSNLQNPDHLYASVNTFSVKLKVISDQGCADSVSQQITVNPLPLISFEIFPSYGSPPLNVSIQNNSSGSNIYVWNFGDGTAPVTGLNPSHTYQNTGIFTVTVVATNSSGCVDSLSKTVEVVSSFLDLAIQEISYVLDNSSLELHAEIFNSGTVVVNRFELRANSDRQSMIRELWQGADPLQPGSTLHYKFNARYELQDGFFPSYYCIELLSANNKPDSILSNNRLCDALTDEFTEPMVFPSPASDHLTVAFNLPLGGPYEICIYESAGKKVYCSGVSEGNKGYNEIRINVNSFANGIYACRVVYGDSQRVKKFLKR